MILKVFVIIILVIIWICNDIKYLLVSGGLNVVKCNLWGLVCSVMEVYFIVLYGNIIFRNM